MVAGVVVVIVSLSPSKQQPPTGKDKKCQRFPSRKEPATPCEVVFRSNPLQTKPASQTHTHSHTHIAAVSCDPLLLAWVSPFSSAFCPALRL